MKVIKAPFSGGGLGHGNGSNLAPNKIEEQLENIYSNESGFECKFEIENIDLDENNIQESHDLIETCISKLKDKAIILGGDHSITYPAVKGFSKNMSDFHFIVFDAHPDLMDNFVPPTQEDYLRVLIEQNIVKAEDVTIIGIRNWDKEELSYLKEKEIKHYTCKEIFDKGIKELMSEVISKINKPIYLSLDIDVLDPSHAPGTGYIEHGGLTTRELIYSIQKIKETNKIAMVDLVEVNPSKDFNNITSILAAKILAELCDY